jgi:hypothetical protein
MTQNEPHDPAVDDLGLSSLDWEDLRIAYLYGTYEPAPGTVDEEAFRRMDAYARSEAERIAALEEADEAWRASKPDRAPQAEPEREAGQ